MDRYSNGSYVIKERIVNVYKEALIISKDDIITFVEDNNKREEKINTNNNPSLKEVDDRFMTIDDLLNNIE